MKKKNLFVGIVLALALALCACGKEAPVETTAAPTVPAVIQPLNLTSYELTATTWSSPNGATITLKAVPNAYVEGQQASFVVRLEGEEVANVPCDWDGGSYTASADLNAENGLCYYVVLTNAEGVTTELAINTPTNPGNEDFINMKDALDSYCSVTVEQSDVSDSKLTISKGFVQVQAPRITNAGEGIMPTNVRLVLNLNGEDITKEDLALNETDAAGLYELDLSGVTMKVPPMDGDQTLTLRLDVQLSNGYILTAPGPTWYNNDGSGLLAAVG